uniref:MFS domain-containing protein n=1 Tax=Onchocerca volvulus TaxID=6282 RepID=A0A8R1XRF6_ONCVO
MYKSLDANKLLNEFGTYGRYQMISYLLCQFTNFFYAISIFIMVFVNRKPLDFACKIDDPTRTGIINSMEPCTIKDLNTGNELRCASLNSGTSIVSNSTDRSHSILIEYQLLCVNPFIQEAGFSIFSAGALFVVPIASHLSDRYGRRRILLISMYLSVIFNFIIAFSPNYAIFILLRFLGGAAADTYLTIGSILCCETVAGSFREWTSLFGVTSWLLGYLYVGVLELFIKDWRKLYFASAIPGLLTAAYFWLLPESPHWMILRKQISGIQHYIEISSWYKYFKFHVITCTFRFNNVEIDLKKCQSENMHKRLKEKFKERTMCDLFKYKRIIYFLFVNGYITMTMNFYYFAVSFDSINLTEHAFMGYILSGLSEIPGGIIVIPLLHFFGRRSITCVSFFLQANATLIIPFVQRIQWARISCSLFGRMINEILFATHPLLANEMMPTTIRTIGCSIINIPQSIGIMFSPLLKYTVS